MMQLEISEARERDKDTFELVVQDAETGDEVGILPVNGETLDWLHERYVTLINHTIMRELTDERE